jgi:isoquinoline 1-oxidoreductase
MTQTLSRREFAKILGAGLLISFGGVPAIAQPAPPPRRGGRGGGGGKVANLAARIHIAKDGAITVMTGKVECGQGARAELTQAAAEELHVSANQIVLIMADTGLVPDDGMTAGSRTSPSTVPAIRQGAAAAREVLIGLAALQWSVPKNELTANEGKIVHATSKREITYGELAANEEGIKAFAQGLPAEITLTPVKEWKVLGTPVARPNRRDLVTGGHQYPSDIARPGMLYGKVLRAPAYGAKMTSVDLAPARAMKDVIVIEDGAFIGVAAPTSFQAKQAIDAITKTAQWKHSPQVSSKDLYAHLKDKAQGGVPKNPFADELAKAAKSIKQSYRVAYVQHTPLEPRAAVAEWEAGKLTVWTGTQNPFGVRSELERAFNLSGGAARVIVPDFGGGFGGKHSGEAAVEAARLAKGAGKPVSLRWTRQEEFTWAYFRPAGVIEVEAGVDEKGSLTSWHFVNINSGPSAVDTPYRAGKARSKYISSAPPLRHGSYRGLASTANNFARESAMDELAVAAGIDPVPFRLSHLGEDRLRAVLEAAVARFDWAVRIQKKEPGVGLGVACGTEKGSYVAACVEVLIRDGQIAVRHVCAAYECGKILNPGNLLSQVQGALVMGLGPALREEMRFDDGVIRNASLADYRVPRFADLPTLDIHLLDRPDLPSVGAGETPIMVIAPAIANAVFHATGVRVREMPIRLPKV